MRFRLIGKLISAKPRQCPGSGRGWDADEHFGFLKRDHWTSVRNSEETDIVLFASMSEEKEFPLESDILTIVVRKQESIYGGNEKHW